MFLLRKTKLVRLCVVEESMHLHEQQERACGNDTHIRERAETRE